MSSVRCGECGVELPDDGDVSRQTPCPQCGSRPKNFAININVNVIGVGLPYNSALAKSQAGKHVGFRESPRDGRTTSATRETDGQLSYCIEGQGSHNEEGALPACQLLVRWLNSRGEMWDNPVERKDDVKDDVDCESRHATDESRRLCIQVVRATVEQDVWRELDRIGVVDRQFSVDDIANKLHKAIEKKTRIPVEQRRQLVLLLDATNLPAHAFDDVREAFVLKHGQWAVDREFVAIYVVGPHDDLIGRLDKKVITAD